MSEQRRRCAHDGGACHHYCSVGCCFRIRECSALSTPHEGFPQTGKYEAKVESMRTVDIEWSGAIFDTPQQATNWANRIKRSLVNEGADPAYIRIGVAATPYDDSLSARTGKGAGNGA